LPDEDAFAAQPEAPDAADPERPRYLTLIKRALGLAVARLDSRDRLRLGCYYGQELTLAQTGRLLGEHEATASRNLARTRKTLRVDVERELRTEAGLNDAQIARCFEVVTEDARLMNLADVLPEHEHARDLPPDRSTRERKTS
jgi:hypothetical protein